MSEQEVQARPLDEYLTMLYDMLDDYPNLKYSADSLLTEIETILKSV